MYVYMYHFKSAKRYVTVVGAKDNIKYIEALDILNRLRGQWRKAVRNYQHQKNVCGRKNKFAPSWNCRMCHMYCKLRGK